MQTQAPHAANRYSGRLMMSALAPGASLLGQTASRRRVAGMGDDPTGVGKLGHLSPGNTAPRSPFDGELGVHTASRFVSVVGGLVCACQASHRALQGGEEAVAGDRGAKEALPLEVVSTVRV